MSRDRGFGLLEAIVALAILGVTATALYDMVAGAAIRRAAAAARLQTLLTAKGLLTQAGLDAARAPGRWPVAAPDGAAWTLTVSPSPESRRLLVYAVQPAGAGAPVLTALRLVEAGP
ncbi:prepilin-type N-terminal cleavage/methylation domain-containing protein [Labrys wisconsinensis]|uniref:Prepilin-type N-terminal cleavage/methylation domain-containing protein n=1 Tax=Labrys wisconsinensis TaxID=425677 RepID=A0ABU0JGV8_9HYPH|nr:prepilin-type N-terminal cleavage/methylation domain-containing protein [Labrys wisconsinensis]MDQ0473530.1 prepilin-type N-terminal cleavage/methylation domain-containing protein [Labrys wisconsinensis]